MLGEQAEISPKSSWDNVARNNLTFRVVPRDGRAAQHGMSRLQRAHTESSDLRRARSRYNVKSLLGIARTRYEEANAAARERYDALMRRTSCFRDPDICETARREQDIQLQEAYDASMTKIEPTLERRGLRAEMVPHRQRVPFIHSSDGLRRRLRGSSAPRPQSRHNPRPHHARNPPPHPARLAPRGRPRPTLQCWLIRTPPTPATPIRTAPASPHSPPHPAARTG